MNIYHILLWLLINTLSAGFYRVNYNRDNWYQLVRALISDPASIHEMNRAQLLDDSFSLARAGLLNYHIPLYLASYLVQESCYFPWAAVIPHVKFIMRRLKGHSAFDDFKVGVLAWVRFQKVILEELSLERGACFLRKRKMVSRVVVRRVYIRRDRKTS